MLYFDLKFVYGKVILFYVLEVHLKLEIFSRRVPNKWIVFKLFNLIKQFDGEGIVIDSRFYSGSCRVSTVGTAWLDLASEWNVVPVHRILHGLSVRVLGPGSQCKPHSACPYSTVSALVSSILHLSKSPFGLPEEFQISFPWRRERH